MLRHFCYLLLAAMFPISCTRSDLSSDFPICEISNSGTHLLVSDLCYLNAQELDYLTGHISDFPDLPFLQSDTVRINFNSRTGCAKQYEYITTTRVDQIYYDYQACGINISITNDQYVYFGILVTRSDVHYLESTHNNCSLPTSVN